MLVKRLYGKFQNDECVMLYESSPDVALLDSFLAKLGESVVTVAARRPHVREQRCVRERKNDHLINAL